MALKERSIASKTLVCLLQGIQGYRTTVELRNENSVTGIISSVDCLMNTSMKDAEFKTLDGKVTKFEQFYISGVQIRFVHIPDCVNIMNTIERQLSLIDGARNKSKFEKKSSKANMKKTAERKMEELKRKLQQEATQS